MTQLVADVGNSRIKWGLLTPDGTDFRATVALPPDEPMAWEKQIAAWDVGERSWVVAGVHPPWRDRLIAWLRERGDRVHLLIDPAELPLRIAVPEPSQVGIDRLLNAVAVGPRAPPGHAAVIVNAGTAVVVDLVDRNRTFRGGAILPGVRLMAQALHDRTALLPFVAIDGPPVDYPGTSTTAAIHSAIWFGVAGAIDRLIAELEPDHGPLAVFLAGGDHDRFAPLRHPAERVGPYLTLDGLRIAARGLSP